MDKTQLLTTNSLSIYGRKKERQKRPILSHDYLIKLRKTPRDKAKSYRPLPSQLKQAITNERRKFLRENALNQRWPLSIQSLILGINAASESPETLLQLKYATSLEITSFSEYNNYKHRGEYVRQLVRQRREKAARIEEREFAEPNFLPLRGLDEDENDFDYMKGREVMREIRTSDEFQAIFDSYVSERERVDNQLSEFLEDSGGFGRRDLSKGELEDGVRELRRCRQLGQSDEEFFKDCLNFSSLLLSNLQVPDLLRMEGQNNTGGGSTEDNSNYNGVRGRGDVEGNKYPAIRNFGSLVQVFMEFFRTRIESLDDAILIIGLGLQILRINSFWKDLRDSMRDPENNGLKSLILIVGLQSGSQLVQEALIELVHDLSFSDFEGRKVNQIVYQDCLEVVSKWLRTTEWHSQDTLGCFMELVEDLFLSAAIFTPEHNTGVLENESEEESDNHDCKMQEEEPLPSSMEEKTQKQPKNQKISIRSRGGSYKVYFRQESKFVLFVTSILGNLLTLDYRLKSEAQTVSECLEESWEGNQDLDEQEAQISGEKAEDAEESASNMMEEVEGGFDGLGGFQLREEDDGIILGSETTTECSEYSDEITDEEDIDQMIFNLINTVSHFIAEKAPKKVYLGCMEVQNNPISFEMLSQHLENWQKPPNAQNRKRFQNIEKLIQKDSRIFISSTKTKDRLFLTKIKHSQFRNLSTEAQISYIKNMSVEGPLAPTSLRMKTDEINFNGFQLNHFKTSFIVELLKTDLETFPKIDLIRNQGSSGLWGDFFYKRPHLHPRIKLEQLYHQKEWLRREFHYEAAVTQIHRILTEGGGEGVQKLANFLGETSKAFSGFIRSILKPELANPLKTVFLSELSREDFRPFRIDRGYHLIEANLNFGVEFGGHVYEMKITNHRQWKVWRAKVKGSNQIRLYGRNSLCVCQVKSATMEELDEMADKYRIPLDGDHLNGMQAGLEGFDRGNVAGARLGRPRRNQGSMDPSDPKRSSKKEGEDETSRNKPKKYLFNRFDILEFKQRKSYKLRERAEFNKLNNKITIDLLRSGAAFLQRLRAKPQNPNRRGQVYIRSPLYSMLIPKKFHSSGFGNKFRVFTQKEQGERQQEHQRQHQEPHQAAVGALQKFSCIYVKRLKKIVLRRKIVRRFKNKMLALQEVECEGKVIDLENPNHLKPYFSKLFTSQGFTKRDHKHTFYNPDDNSLPAFPIKSQFFYLNDFTKREHLIAKTRFLVQDSSKINPSPSHITLKGRISSNRSLLSSQSKMS